jgi:outer membrane protein OmpA-like peptidoglycan-associated protein
MNTQQPVNSPSIYRKAIYRKAIYVAVALFFASPRPATGQNLVANNSFEDINTCSEYGQPCSPSAWFFEKRKVTSGYFPRFHSATGQRHLQIVAASRETPNRQYWETILLSPLVAGERYRIDVKLAATSGGPNLRDIGFWFTNNFIFSWEDSLLQPGGYLQLMGASSKDLKNGWFEIKKEFTATKTASILIMGNFTRQSNADILDQRNLPDNTIEVLVDDLVISPVKETPCPACEKVKDALYSITARHWANPIYTPSGTPPETDIPSGYVIPPDSVTNILPPSPVANTIPEHPANPTARQPQPQAPKPNRPDSPHLSTTTDTLRINNIQFEFDQYKVTNPDTLEHYRAYLTRPDIKKVTVLGFTDDRGTAEYNKDLSDKRAHAVARLLTSKFGIPGSIIEAEGKGISREYKDKYQNRRVEIYLYH